MSFTREILINEISSNLDLQDSTKLLSQEERENCKNNVLKPAVLYFDPGPPAWVEKNKLKNELAVKSQGLAYEEAINLDYDDVIAPEKASSLDYDDVIAPEKVSSLAFIAENTASENAVKLYDNKRVAQDFFAELFRLLDHPAIDLADEDKKVSLLNNLDQEKLKSIHNYLHNNLAEYKFPNPDYLTYQDVEDCIISLKRDIPSKATLEKYLENTASENAVKLYDNKQDFKRVAQDFFAELFRLLDHPAIDLADEDKIVSLLNNLDHEKLKSIHNYLYNNYEKLKSIHNYLYNNLAEYKFPNPYYLTYQDVKDCIISLKRDIPSKATLEKYLNRDNGISNKPKKTKKRAYADDLGSYCESLYDDIIDEFLYDKVNVDYKNDLAEMATYIYDFYYESNKYTNLEELYIDIYHMITVRNNDKNSYKILLLLNDMYYRYYRYSNYY